MKKTLLTLFLFVAFGFSQAQNLVTENFDVFPAAWTKLNVSAPVGANAWAAGAAANIANINAGGGAYNGTAATSYAYVNFNSTTGTGVISNWLITTPISLINGDVISFYAVKGLSGGTTVYPDALQMRISTNGAASAAPVGATGLGDYTTLAVDINPGLTTTDFPTTWTQYTYTVTGLPVATSCRVAFRYTVPTSGGPTGNNSDQIGIDAYSVDRPVASTADFFTSNFSIHPNPVKDILNVTSVNGANIETIQILDINGRIVNQPNTTATETTQINVSDLNAGVYFVKVQSELGIGTTKFIKN